MNEATGNHIIRFTASWCGPCKMYAPVFEAVVATKSNIHTHVIDIDDDMLGLIDEYNVRSVPTTVMIRDGQIVDTVLGAVPASRLHELIDKHFLV